MTDTRYIACAHVTHSWIYSAEHTTREAAAAELFRRLPKLQSLSTGFGYHGGSDIQWHKRPAAPTVDHPGGSFRIVSGSIVESYPPARPVPAPAVDLTPIGEQFVIPGCERDQRVGPAQMNLFGRKD